MIDILIGILATAGSLFVLIASLGILKMPDFYTRLSVTIKAATLGIGCILSAAALYFYDFAVTSKSFAIIFFLILTAPIAAHIVGKVAYKTGIKMWENSVLDQLKGKYEEDKAVKNAKKSTTEDATVEPENEV